MLFGELVYELIREKMIIGSNELADSDTHLGIDALSEEVSGGKNKNYVVYAYDREADIVALDEDVEQED